MHIDPSMPAFIFLFKSTLPDFVFFVSYDCKNPAFNLEKDGEPEDNHESLAATCQWDTKWDLEDPPSASYTCKREKQSLGFFSSFSGAKR